MSSSHDAAFGIDAFALDDRIRLFTFVATEKRLTYLWVLRAFDHARANYHVLMHTGDIAAQLAALARTAPIAHRSAATSCPRFSTRWPTGET